MNDILTLLKKETNILLLNTSDENSKILNELLNGEYNIDSTVDDIDYDLMIIDQSDISEIQNKLQKVAKKQELRFLPILLLTTNEAEEYKKSEYLFDDVIRKPITKAALKIRICNLLNMRELFLKSKELEKKYWGIFNKLNDAVFIHRITEDGLGEFLEVNKKACQALGYNKEELLKMSPQDIDSSILTEDDYKKVIKTLKEKGSIRFKTEHMTKQGMKIPVEINAHTMEIDKKKVVVSIARDISEQQQSKEQLEMTLSKAKNLSVGLENLIDLSNYLSRSSLQNEILFLSDLLEVALKLIDVADYGSVAKYDGEHWVTINTIGYGTELLKELNLKRDYLYNSEEQLAEKKVIEIYNSEKMKAVLPRKIIDELDLVFKEIKESLYLDIFLKDDIKKIRISLDIANSNNDHFSDSDKKMLESFRNLATSFYTIKEYNDLQGAVKREIIIAMIRTLEIHDQYTKGHSENVAEVAKKIAKKMGLNSEEIDKIYWAGLVHDIGKILISKKILNKPSALTTQEYKIIKKHPQWAYKILSNSKNLKKIAQYVLYHHEYWNGEGYPEGKIAEEIPLESRIISVADAWDAMTSTRSYRKAMPEGKALAIIKENKGSQFAPSVVDAFMQLKEI
ncbi:HD domain-containing phosphohydrolase [Halanaerobacter jeridensis]|uniref:PAS domain S-box-containing protein/putative nucleotidyltransferase with HDIG domain n=1 Tax=Halanaerobacter jeridensis TaxID=706427 RepID=A0A938XVR2_9FIRM|nr:HD domain-containing phosphohydrolase [Halanaerobacter jeridensis]MBM7556487.1 PAS domain S-box-containing protein/putative nucleotidyltransferase with HDIG domain [Halanaerobacter jeridensis]